MKKIFTLLLIVCSLSSFAQSTLRCYKDFDNDGYGDPNNSIPPIPNQGCSFGYVQDNTDCDDNNALVHQLIWYRDFDGDGYGDGTSIESCSRPTGYVGELFFAEIDCNDNDSNIQPILWYLDKDHDRYAFNEAFIVSCTPPDGPYVSQSQLKGFDCDDNDANIFPRVYYTDADGDGYRSLAAPIHDCVALTDPALHLASEFNTPDIDCDDENSLIGTGPAWYKDQDNDGYTDGTILRSCVQPEGYISSPIANPGSPGSFYIDCNDSDPLEHPNQFWILDDDLDHYGQSLLLGGNIVSQCNRPSGNWFASSELLSQVDCDDGNASVTMRVWVLDADNDSYYTGDPVSQCEYPGAGYVEKLTRLPGDCNDNDPAISPFTIWYKDADGDGYNDPNIITTERSCTAPGSGYSNSTKGPDCDDNDPTVNPETIWYRDADGDGYNNAFVITQPSCTPPGAGYSRTTKGADCNDNDPALPATYWYKDADGDGYHNELVASITAPSCTPPTSEFRATTKGPDCNDADALINPETVWYKDSDGDGYTDGWFVGHPSCTSPGGSEFKLTTKGSDCNDNDASINPETVWYLDADNDGYYTGIGITRCEIFLAGYKRSGLLGGDDCNDNDETVHQRILYYIDADKDGYGSTVSEMLCSLAAPTGFSTNNTDCDDNNGTINPATVWIKDIDQDGYYSSPTIQCTSPGPGYVIKTTQLLGDCNDDNASVNPGAEEVCSNKIDDNCNGIVDEGSCYTCDNGTNLTTTMITSTSAQLNWVANANPVYWQIQYKTTKPGSRWVDLKPEVTGNKRSVQITGLSARVNYLWHIKARCGNSWTTYSVSVAFTTLASGITQKRSAETPEKTVVSATEAFDIQASPNPSQQSFRIVIGASNLNEPVKLIVTDILGRVVETRITNAGQIITIGENYRSGLYLIQALLGNEKKQLKLIKL